MTNFDLLSWERQKEWMSKIHAERQPGIVIYSWHNLPVMTINDPLNCLWALGNYNDNSPSREDCLLQQGRNLQAFMLFMAQRLEKGYVDRFHAAEELREMAREVITTRYEDEPNV